jgi:hypothetical protein
MLEFVSYSTRVFPDNEDREFVLWYHVSEYLSTCASLERDTRSYFVGILRLVCP